MVGDPTPGMVGDEGISRRLASLDPLGERFRDDAVTQVEDHVGLEMGNDL